VLLGQTPPRVDLPFTIWTVDKINTAADYSTIQAAINAASSGDVIMVGPGTYAEQLTLKAGVRVIGTGVCTGETGSTARTYVFPTIAADGSAIVGPASGVTYLENIAARADGATGNNRRTLAVTTGTVKAKDCCFHSEGIAVAAGTLYTVLASGGNVVLRGCLVTQALPGSAILPGAIEIDNAASEVALDSCDVDGSVWAVEITGGLLTLLRSGKIGLINRTGGTITMNGDVKVTDILGINDTTTETNLTHDVYGVALTNGKNDLYKLNLRAITGDVSSPANGDLWYNNSTGKFRGRQGAVDFNLRDLRETGGPTELAVAAIADGQYLRRSGATIIGATPGGTGDVVGPASATDGAVALFDTTTGKLLKNGFVSHVRLELGVSSPSAVITTGAKGRKYCSITGTIIGWRLVADVSATVTLDLWKAAGAIPTNANSITASAKPALSAAELAASTTLTGWTTAVTAGDVFILEVEANNNAKYLALELWIKES